MELGYLLLNSCPPRIEDAAGSEQLNSCMSRMFKKCEANSDYFLTGASDSAQ
jgi:hypothetical protein